MNVINECINDLLNQYNFKQKSDEKTVKYKLGDYFLIQYQVFLTSNIGVVWQKVRRTTIEILGLIGLP